MYHKVTTLTEFILSEEKKVPDATGSFTLLLTILENSIKIIGSHIRKTGLVDILGASGGINTYGEEVQKLDEFANMLLIDTLIDSGLVYAVGSEELEKPIFSNNLRGDYVVFFDPLDGSSNISTNASMGSIFSIYKAPPLNKRLGSKQTEKEILFKGSNQIAAGYALYGSSIMFVYTAGEGVNGFTLDPSIGSFLLSNPNMRVPEEGKIYSINEGLYELLDSGNKKYLDGLKKDEYRTRYIACMVADVHRILLQGGIFIYPQNKKDKNGKLRLIYEVNPMSYIIEQAGGKSVGLDNKSPLVFSPKNISERQPVALGSKKEVERYVKYFK